MISSQFMREASNAMLAAMLGNNKLVQTWWSSPNKAFANKTPNAVFESNPDTVYKYLTSHMEGNW